MPRFCRVNGGVIFVFSDYQSVPYGAMKPGEKCLVDQEYKNISARLKEKYGGTWSVTVNGASKGTTVVHRIT